MAEMRPAVLRMSTVEQLLKMAFLRILVSMKFLLGTGKRRSDFNLKEAELRPCFELPKSELSISAT